MTLTQPSNRRSAILLSLSLTLSLALAGCGGGSSTPAPPPAAATELTLSAVSSDASVGGAPLPLNAALNGSGTVTWQLAAGSAGTLSSTSGASVSYAPPASSSVNAVAKVTISATAGSMSKTITLNLLPDPNKPGLSLLAGSTDSPSNANASADGVGTAARFAAISGITANAAGLAYVTENLPGLVRKLRKIAPDGSVTTVLANLPFMLDPIVSASVKNPSIAPDGSLYFTQYQQSMPREVNVYYTSKLGLDGSLGTLASVRFPSFGSEVLASPDGKVYRYDSVHINRLNADGSEQLLAGSAIEFAQVDGSGAQARFSGLKYLAADNNGNLVALDQGSVRRITPAGVVTTLASFPDAPDPYSSASLAPVRIGVDGNGTVLLLYVSKDKSYYEIRKLSGSAIAPLYQVGLPNGPYDIRPLSMQVLQDGTLLLTRDTSVTRLSTDGKISILAGTEDASYATLDGDGDAARYVRPGMLAADKAGNVYSVEDVSNFYKLKIVIRKTTPAGNVSTYASADLGLNITGMLVTPAGQLMVSLVPRGGANQFGGGIYQVEAGNKFTLIAGAPGANTGKPLQQDGAGAAARFGSPTLAGVDSAGNLYVRDRVDADSGATNVRKITPQALVSTQAGLPAGLNAAPDGNVYQADALDPGLIYRIAPDGTKFLIAGGNGSRSIVLGALPGTLLPVGSIVATGPNSLALASGSAIVKLVLPK